MTNLKIRNILMSDLELFKEPLVKKMKPVSYMRWFLIRGSLLYFIKE